MRLFELFLNETTEEDRAIISLSSSISQYIKKYETQDDDGDSWKNKDYADDLDFDDISEIEDDKPIKLGKIGHIFNTPLEALQDINLELQSDYGLRLRRKKEDEDKKITRPEDKVTYGMWYPDTNTILLNKDFIGSNALKTVISHELRHALDDVKSDYEANKVGGRYSIPRKKEHRKKDPYSEYNFPYIAQPAEINSRFVEVLHSLVNFINQTARNPNLDLKDQTMREFKRQLQTRKISLLFPEKEKSPYYKRLIKRGVDFIDKEINYINNKK